MPSAWKARTERDWAAKAGLIRETVDAAARESTTPTIDYVAAFYAAHHGGQRLASASVGTIRNWLKPGCADIPFHTEDGAVVADEAGGRP